MMADYQPAADCLRDRVILVTGAGDGIGRAVALACAAHGATLVLVGRTEGKLEKVYDAIEKAGYPQPAIVPLNMESATPREYQQLAELLTDELGRLDGLLHNAAALGIPSPLQHYDVDIWYRVMQVNLHAPFLLTKACLPLLQRAPDPTVVFTSAEVGRRGRAYWGAYGVAKAGLEGLMQTLAHEMEGTPVRVNSLDPGRCRTNLRAKAYPGEDPNTVPLPETVVPSFLYLLGPDSQGIHGQALVSD